MIPPLLALPRTLPLALLLHLRLSPRLVRSQAPRWPQRPLLLNPRCLMPLTFPHFPKGLTAKDFAFLQLPPPPVFALAIPYNFSNKASALLLATLPPVPRTATSGPYQLGPPKGAGKGYMTHFQGNPKGQKGQKGKAYGKGVTPPPVFAPPAQARPPLPPPP